MTEFLASLMAASVLTGLITEAVKALLTDGHYEFSANILASIVSVIVGAAIGVGYTLYTGGAFDTQRIIEIIALIVLSWLCAMEGYDKIKEAIKQIGAL